MYREMKWSVVNRKHIYAHVNHREMFLSIQFTIESYHYHLKILDDNQDMVFRGRHHVCLASKFVLIIFFRGDHHAHLRK
jgi:hypothetical protein